MAYWLLCPKKKPQVLLESRHWSDLGQVHLSSEAFRLKAGLGKDIATMRSLLSTVMHGDNVLGSDCLHTV